MLLFPFKFLPQDRVDHVIQHVQEKTVGTQPKSSKFSNYLINTPHQVLRSPGIGFSPGKDSGKLQNLTKVESCFGILGKKLSCKNNG